MSNSASDNMLRLALVAHDAQKSKLVAWVGENLDVFEKVKIVSTGTTGGMLVASYPQLHVTPLKSGPLGGDQQIGALICEEKLDALVFFTDPLSPMPHDVDVKALTRLATVYDLPSACSPSTANLIAQGIRKGYLVPK